MSQYLVRATIIAVGLTLTVAPHATAEPEVVRVGNIFLIDNGGIFPSKLPKRGRAPISALLHGAIGTVDGSHPPALKSVSVNIDRTIQVNARGLPVCKRSKLVARSTAAAKEACPDAIVGSGEGNVEVAFPEQSPFTAKGPIVLFNGGVSGGTTLVLIHAYVAIPAPTAVVVPVKITRIHHGRFGMHVFAQIPKIAGGYGSVTKFNIKVGRKFTYKGKKQSYLTASCPTGHYVTEGKVLFVDGTKLGLAHVLPCTPED